MNIKTLSKTLNRAILKSGINGLGRSEKLNPIIMQSYDVKSFIREYFSEVPETKIDCLDGKYRIITEADWKNIDADIYDITKKPYETGTYDCDDRAYVQKYWAIRIYGIPQLIVHGHLYNKDGSWIGGHFWNARIIDGKLFFYEPSGNEMVEVEKGKPIWIGNREYRPLTFEF